MGDHFFSRTSGGHLDTLKFCTDSAGAIRLGADFGRHWLHGLWPASWQTYNIAVLELFPIVIAIHIVDIISKQTSKHTALMALLRDLILSCLMPHSHQSLNTFKSCLIKQGLKLFSL